MVLGVLHLNLIIHFSDREQRYSFLTHHDSPLSSTSQGEGIPHSGRHIYNFIAFPGIVGWQVISSRDQWDVY